MIGAQHFPLAPWLAAALPRCCWPTIFSGDEDMVLSYKLYSYKTQICVVVSKIYGVNKIPNNHHKYVGWPFWGVHDFDIWGVDNFDDLWTFMISWNGCHNYQPTTCQNLTHPVWGVENLNHPSQWMLFPTNIGCLDIPQRLSWPLFQQNRGSSIIPLQCWWLRNLAPVQSGGLSQYSL